MPREPLPDELAVAAFTTADARDLGVGRGRLRGRDLAHPHHGVHAVRGGGDDIHSRCERLLPALGPSHWFSHRTAARLWGMPVEPAYHPDEGLHVPTVGSRTPLRHVGTIGWGTVEVGTPRGRVGGIPVIAPADVWCQLATRGAVHAGRLMSHVWLVAAGDFLLTGPRIGSGRRGPALCTREELDEAVRRRGSGRGVRILRRALADVRAPVDSPRETLLRLGLVACGLPEPQVQVPVMTARGLRHADLGYPESRLLLEYQGDEHRTSRRRWLADLTRAQLFEDAGYATILVGAHDLYPDCAALAARIRRRLARENTR